MSSSTGLILSSLSADVLQQFSKPSFETREEVVVDVPAYQIIFKESGLDVFWSESIVAYENFKQKYLSLKNSQVRRILEEELHQKHRSDFDSLQAKVIQVRNSLFPLASDDNTLINFTSEIDTKISALSEGDLITTFKKACECGDSEIVQKILATKRLETVGDTHARDVMLRASFKEAGTKGYIEIIHSMKESVFFPQIPGDILGETLVASGQNGYEDVTVEIIESGRLRDVSDEKISEAFKEAAIHGLVEVVRKLIASPRFQNISQDDLGGALQNGAELNHLEIVQDIIASNRFNEISAKDLGETLIATAVNGHSDIINTLIASTRFGEIYTYHLGWALQYATENDHADIVNALIASTRFNEISANYVKGAFYCASLDGRTDIFNAIIASTRFNEISTEEDLELALQKASGNGHADIINALTVALKQLARNSSYSPD